MWRCVLLLACMTPALADGPALQADFSQQPGVGFRCVGDAVVQDGVLRTRSQAGWQRSGLEVGPLPVPGAAWTIEYDFRPVAFGAQGAEFASASPSTHWYMAYVHPGGGINLHTRQGGEWKARGSSPQVIKAGQWYHARVVLTGTSLQHVVLPRGSDEVLWDSGVVAVEDMGKETTPILVDEAADTAAQTEWDNVTVATDNAAARGELQRLVAEAVRQQRLREEKLAMCRQLREQGIAIIPTPQQVKLIGESVPVSDFRIVSDAGSKGSVVTVAMVVKERLGLACQGGTPLKLVSWPVKQKAPWANAQGYRLRVGKAGVVVEAQAKEGFLYGAQTLCQLVNGNGSSPLPFSLARGTAARSGEGNVPGCEVTDWPDIEKRLVMIAIDQGAFQVVDVDYWKRLIRELAAVKINYVMPYFEGAGFFYEKYPYLALKGRDGFTIEKGKLLSEYAMQHGIRLVPQQQTLGHSGSVLSHPELKHLQESGGVYCSSNPETFQFIGDLFDELLQAFPCADAIHVGGDEFGHGFAKCDQCKARADEIGKAGLYAEHMMKVRQLLADRKRGMMIWWHEGGYTDEARDKLAKDITVFDWHYGNQSSYPTLQRLQDEGFVNTWATPAVTRYYDGGDDWNNTFGNISGFLAAGAARRVPGECTCTWVHGIWGGRNLFELNLYGVVFSGQCAWNAAASDYADYRWRFARQWFGVSGSGHGPRPSGSVTPPTASDLDRLVLDAIHEPHGSAKEQGFWRGNRVLEEMLAAPLSKTAEALAEKPELAGEAQRLEGSCQQAYAAIAELRKLATRNAVTLDFMAHDVHIHHTLARRILLTQHLVKLWPQLGALPPAERAAKLQPVRDGLQRLTEEYTQMEKMFDRSILEAGGGRCVAGGWPADGGIVFRAQQGKAEVEKALVGLQAAMKVEKLPEKAF